MDTDDKIDKAIQDKGCPIFSVVGIIITIPTVALAAVINGMSHNLFEQILFPFPTMLSEFIRALPFIGLAVLQFPLYGLILDRCRERSRLFMGIAILTIFHISFIAICFASNFS